MMNSKNGPYLRKLLKFQIQNIFFKKKKKNYAYITEGTPSVMTHAEQAHNTLTLKMK
jgi:hypothetical protein